MVSRIAGRIAVGVLVVAGLGSQATTQPVDQTIPAKLIMVKFSGAPPVGKLAKIVSKGSFTLPDQIDGGLTDGSVTFDYGTLGQVTCTLPQQPFDGTEGWKGMGNPYGSRGFKYINTNAPGGIAGPCKIVIVKPNVIKILAKGTGSLLPPGPPGTNSDASVLLVAGWELPGFHEMRYCASSVGGTRVEAANKLVKDKEAPAPPLCGPGRFVDNGDGTITDPETGLMWEKKDGAGGIHDVDNWYIWAGCCYGSCESVDDYCQPNTDAAWECLIQSGGMDGCRECFGETCETWGRETIWEWIVQVNTEGGSGFAGHSDWRIPSEGGCNSCWETAQCPCDPAELETILLEPYECEVHPCVDPVFDTSCTPGCSVSACSCTAPDYWYWSSTTLGYDPGGAWFVSFYDGHVAYFDGYYGDGRVRAVRGGSPSTAFLDVTSGLLD